MSSILGEKLRVSVFGESHGAAVGAVADGFPAGEAIDENELKAFMRRRQGGGPLSTPRKEADEVEFLSGVFDGKTTGTPLCAVIRNADARSRDYEKLRDLPRPGHADYTAFLKWDGQADMRGGGHFSARLTAPLCAVGGVAKQILERKGVFLGAHLMEVAGETDDAFPLYPTAALFREVAGKDFPVLSDEAGARMRREIESAAAEKDSVGGVVECCVTGVMGGLGGPLFGGVEGALARALFGIPAVKGVEFGAGFSAARLRGSENNDAFCLDGQGNIRTETNRAGGILGGITNGMPLVVRAAFKPTPSIAREQRTVRLSAGEEAPLTITGRHDPCVAHRAVPVVEAVAALVILDLILEGK